MEIRQKQKTVCYVFQLDILFFTALLLFGVKIIETSIVYLSDNTGTDIPQNLFLQIIKFFWNGSSFHVEIKYTPVKNNNNELVTSNVRKYTMNVYNIFYCTYSICET